MNDTLIYDARGNVTQGDGLSQAWDNRNRLSESRIIATNSLLGRYLYNERGLRLKAERFILPTVQVVQPNGGEGVFQGDLNTITWNNMGVTGTFKLELLVNGVVAGTIAENLPATQTSYQWQVGKILTGWVNPDTNCKVRVSSMALPIATTTYYFYDSTNYPSILTDLVCLSIMGSTNYPSTQETDLVYLPFMDSAGRLLAEYDQSGVCVKDYIYMGGKLLAEYQPSGSKYYYYTSDQINSTRIITDSSGTVVYSALFDPYGGMQKEWVNTYQPSLKFSGKEREGISELDYFGARYYGHKQYRFLSVDPVINKAEAIANPQLWNLYSYCGNNPISFYDPDGKEAITIAITTSPIWFPAVVKAVTITVVAVAALITGKEAYDAIKRDRDLSILQSKSKGRIKGMPDSIDTIHPDKSGAKGGEHAHGETSEGKEWSIKKDGTTHDGQTTRVPKDASDFLKGKGWDIPADRFPKPNPK